MGIEGRVNRHGGKRSEGALADRVRLPLTFDPEPLREDVARFREEEWVRHFVPANYEGQWTILPLRSPVGESHPVRMSSASLEVSHFVDTYFLDRAPALRAALARFPCGLRSARLMRLSPGSLIREHSDPYLDIESGYARLHVPIATNDRVEFRVNGRPVEMEPGSCWYLRLSDPHQAANRGETDRVHLVVDAVVDEWVLGMLAKGSVE